MCSSLCHLSLGETSDLCMSHLPTDDLHLPIYEIAHIMHHSDYIYKYVFILLFGQTSWNEY